VQRSGASIRKWRQNFVRAIFDDPYHLWTPEEQIGLAMEWSDRYGAPAEVYRYSDTGYWRTLELLEQAEALRG
jgi:hypothetical protein